MNLREVCITSLQRTLFLTKYSVHRIIKRIYNKCAKWYGHLTAEAHDESGILYSLILHSYYHDYQKSKNARNYYTACHTYNTESQDVYRTFTSESITVSKCIHLQGMCFTSNLGYRIFCMDVHELAFERNRIEKKKKWSYHKICAEKISLD